MKKKDKTCELKVWSECECGEEFENVECDDMEPTDTAATALSGSGGKPADTVYRCAKICEGTSGVQST